jgi:hypothetical protein
MLVDHAPDLRIDRTEHGPFTAKVNVSFDSLEISAAWSDTSSVPEYIYRKDLPHYMSLGIGNEVKMLLAAHALGSEIG